MPTDHYDTRGPLGCSRTLKACLVVGALVAVGLIGLLIVMARMPAMRGIMKCRSNIIAVGEALRRYHDVTGRYPSSLDALKKDYLKDQSVLRCPLASRAEGRPDYTYHRPPPDAKGSFVVLECRRHRLRRDTSPTRLRLRLDGRPEIDSPALGTQRGR